VLEKYKTSARRGLNDEQRKKRLALFGENTDMSGGLYKWTKTHGSIKQQVQTKLEAYWVLIDSEWRKRPSITLVPGDIVLVSEGQVVPADLRIIRTWSCWLENGHATWTTARWASTSSDGNTNWLNSPNMAYQKMWINSQGYLIGVVLATGETTVANTQYYYHYPLKFAVDPEAKMFTKLASDINIYIRDMFVLTRLRGLQYIFMNFDILLHHKKSHVASVFYNNKIYQPEEIDAADPSFVQLHRAASLVNSAHIHSNKTIGTNGFDRVIALFLERFGSVSKWRKTHERYSNTSSNTFGVYLEESEEDKKDGTENNDTNNNNNNAPNNNFNAAIPIRTALKRKVKKAANNINVEAKFGARIALQVDDAYTILNDQTVQYWINNGVIEELDNDTREFVKDMIKVLAERKYIMIGYTIKLLELSRNVFVGFIALDVPFKPPAVKQSVELLRTLGYKQLYMCRYNMYSIRAFMEALSLECFNYNSEVDTAHWPLIGPGRAPVQQNDWDQFGMPVWNDGDNNNNNNNDDQPPEGEPPRPPDETKSEEAKKLLASKVILHEGDLDYSTANKLLSASILCTAVSTRNAHCITALFGTLTTLRRPFITIGCTLADSLILSSSPCKMFFSRMLGVCYYYAVSELVCLSQRVSDLARFMEELKKKDQYLQTHPNAVAMQNNCTIS
jgi:hypothetical protein